MMCVAMHTDFMQWLKQHEGRAYDLHEKHVNPVFVKMLKTIGFDKGYTRGQGCYLWDRDGNKYLDLLTGWGVSWTDDGISRAQRRGFLPRALRRSDAGNAQGAVQ